MLGSVCSIGSVLVSVLTTPEIPPSEQEPAALKAKKAQGGGATAAIKEIGDAIAEMPTELRKLALVYLFQWYGVVCYWCTPSACWPRSACSSSRRSTTSTTRYGVYMGIINMMIVIPMLIQSVTFGAIYQSILGDNPNNAIRFAAVFLALAALAMQWIKEPPIVRDVDAMNEPVPMGGGH